MVTIDYGVNNRLGNMLFNRVAAWVFAKKHNYFISAENTLPKFKNSEEDREPVSTGFGEAWCDLKVSLTSGTKSFSGPIVCVTEQNYLQLLESDNVPDAHYHFCDYFQIPEFLLKYEKEIRSFFNLNYQERDPKEIFVAVRLGDAAHCRARLPRAYYEDAITRLYAEGCKGGFITSDSILHPDVMYLKDKFDLLPYVNHTPMSKINFAKNFNNLVLSEGSFSFWMGYLSKAERVYINDRRHLFTWHHDIFVVPTWRKLCYDSPELPG